MTTYTANEARGNLALLLNEARQQGAVEIRDDDGEVYVLKFVSPSRGRSPLDVPRTKVDISTDEIVEIVREGRKWPRS